MGGGGCVHPFLVPVPKIGYYLSGTYLHYTSTYASFVPPVPPSHLVRGVARVSTPAHQGQQVTAEQHLHDANASVAENPSERLSERVHVVDAEPVVGAASKTSCVFLL